MNATISIETLATISNEPLKTTDAFSVSKDGGDGLMRYNRIENGEEQPILSGDDLNWNAVGVFVLVCKGPGIVTVYSGSDLFSTIAPGGMIVIPSPEINLVMRNDSGQYTRIALYALEG